MSEESSHLSSIAVAIPSVLPAESNNDLTSQYVSKETQPLSFLILRLIKPILQERHNMAQVNPSDTGFDYVSINNSEYQHLTIPTPLAPPVKSDIGDPSTTELNVDNPVGPTFWEEQRLEEYERGTEKEQIKDLNIKKRVQVTKLILRGVSFSCSLIVLAMLSTTFTIYNATKHLAPRNHFPPWAQRQKTWPQITVLVIACFSLAFCLLTFWGYWRGGHRKAEKVAVYSTVFAVVCFIFSIVMWAIAAAILQQSKNTGNGKDIWGWACVDNDRRELFQDDVNYVLVCKIQNWSLVCCLVEIVLEFITAVLYGIIFYRYYSKQRLRKSMNVRDRARSDFYLTQLRSQSIPKKVKLRSLDTESTVLQHYPTEIRSATSRSERMEQPVPAAPGEKSYNAVPIPGPYAHIQGQHNLNISGWIRGERAYK